jgi:hypothetical protein
LVSISKLFLTVTIDPDCDHLIIDFANELGILVSSLFKHFAGRAAFTIEVKHDRELLRICVLDPSVKIIEPTNR